MADAAAASEATEALSAAASVALEASSRRGRSNKIGGSGGGGQGRESRRCTSQEARVSVLGHTKASVVVELGLLVVLLRGRGRSGCSKSCDDESTLILDLSPKTAFIQSLGRNRLNALPVEPGGDGSGGRHLRSSGCSSRLGLVQLVAGSGDCAIVRARDRRQELLMNWLGGSVNLSRHNREGARILLRGTRHGVRIHGLGSVGGAGDRIRIDVIIEDNLSVRDLLSCGAEESRLDMLILVRQRGLVAVHHRVLLNLDEWLLAISRKGLFTTIADYRKGVTDKRFRCFRGKGVRHTAVFRLWDTADSDNVEDSDSTVSEAFWATLEASLATDSALFDTASVAFSITLGFPAFLFDLFDLGGSFFYNFREAGSCAVFLSRGLFVSFLYCNSLLSSKLHGIAIKPSQFLGSDRGNLHALIFDSCGGILSLEKTRVGDNQLLELLGPLIEGGLELMVLGPVLVGDSVSPCPPHTDLLQGEVSSLVEHLEVNIGNGDNSFLELLTLEFLINCGLKLFEKLLAISVDLFLNHTLGNVADALFQVSGTLIGLCGKLGLPSIQVLSHHLPGLASIRALVFAGRRGLHRVDVLLRRLNHGFGALCGNRGLRGGFNRLDRSNRCGALEQEPQKARRDILPRSIVLGRLRLVLVTSQALTNADELWLNTLSID
ncbi:hypothetical protein HG531_011320 [Fusarium graminearum]|nr:hypothetical protein HG531_011320 [Fusarium graminearum]